MSATRQQQQQPTSMSRNEDTRQPVVYTFPRQRSIYYETYCCRQSMCIGTTLLITGLLSVVLQAVSIAAGLILSAVSHGIWCGVVFVINGVVGLAAGVQKSLFLIVLFMTLSIVSAVLSIPLFCLSLTSALLNGMAANYFRLPLEALSLCLMMMSLIAATAAVWGSILGCLALCCSRPTMVFGTNLSTLLITQQQQQPYTQPDRQVTSRNPGSPPAYTQRDRNAVSPAPAVDAAPPDKPDFTSANHQ